MSGKRNYVKFSSDRRERAIAPYLEKEAWSIFHSFEDLEENYTGGWISGEVRSDEYPIDFSVKHKRNSRRLAVVFNSQQKADSNLKLFTWTKVAEKINCSRLHISDPTLNISNSAPVGWYTCNKVFNAQLATKKLIDRIAEALDIEEFVFLGSSGGGFPAAHFTSYYQNSISLLLAPTLSVPRSQQAAPDRPFVQDLNDSASMDELVKSTPAVNFDLTTVVPNLVPEDCGRFHILQSKSDNIFWEGQSYPFLRSMGYECLQAPKYLAWELGSAIYGDWGVGHAPPPVETIECAVDAIAQTGEGKLRNFMLPLSLTSSF